MNAKPGHKIGTVIGRSCDPHHVMYYILHFSIYVIRQSLIIAFLRTVNYRCLRCVTFALESMNIH